jgi:hypothetical protein
MTDGAPVSAIYLDDDRLDCSANAGPDHSPQPMILWVLRCFTEFISDQT